MRQNDFQNPGQTDSFIQLQGTHNPNRWYLPVVEDLCVGPPDNMFLFGGVGLATSIQAMERTCGRPAIWATAQYLSFARPGSVVDYDVIVPVQGRNLSQARVIGHVGDREIFTVNAALGARDDAMEAEFSEQWAGIPDNLPSPEDCEPRAHWRGAKGDLHSHMDTRVIKGRFGIGERDGTVSEDGHVMLWARLKDSGPLDSTALAVIADFVPSAVGNAIGHHAGGTSIDNTIRFRKIVPTQWVLLDIRIHGVHGGFAQGRMHLFSEDGELMATASQSMIMRLHGGPDK